MRAQGVSDDRIVEALQRQGYLSSQIFDALTQAGMSPATEENQVSNEFPDISQSLQFPPQPPPQTAPPPLPPQQQQATPQQASSAEGYDERSAEELIESIIEEKWSEIEEDVQKVVDWKKDTEKRIKSLEQEFAMLKEQFDKLHQAVIGKIGEYDKNILNVGAEIKAMEKAFSKIIPEFAESVTQLTELVEDLKKHTRNPKKKH